MRAIKKNDVPPALDSWGSPSDAGAEIIEGPVSQWGSIVVGQIEGDIHAGFYSASKGKFRFRYPYSEHSTVLKGEVTITDETNGVTASFGPGDSWIIEKDASIIWDIGSETVVVSYLGASTPLLRS